MSPSGEADQGVTKVHAAAPAATAARAPSARSFATQTGAKAAIRSGSSPTSAVPTTSRNQRKQLAAALAEGLPFPVAIRWAAAAGALAGLGNVHSDRAAIELGAVERGNGRVGRLIVLESDKPETTRATRVAIGDELDFAHLAVVPLEQLADLPLYTPDGQRITLGSVATLRVGETPDTIRRTDRQTAVILSANRAEQITTDFRIDETPMQGAERTYIIDPLGNLMMYYPPDADARGMLLDLKKLLKFSKIG